MGKFNLDDLVFDKKNPRSLANVAPTGLMTMINRIGRSGLMVSEDAIKARLGQSIPQLLTRTRLAFWKEYDAAITYKREMSWSGISAHIGRPAYAITQFFTQTLTLSYILIPPPSYDAAIEDALGVGLERVREILNLPLYDKDGNPDANIAKTIMSAVAFLDMRVHGGFVQRSASLEVKHTTGGGSFGQGAPKPVADMMAKLGDLKGRELDKKIKELEQQLEQKKADGRRIKVVPSVQPVNDLDMAIAEVTIDRAEGSNSTTEVTRRLELSTTSSLTEATHGVLDLESSLDEVIEDASGGGGYES